MEGSTQCALAQGDVMVVEKGKEVAVEQRDPLCRSAAAYDDAEAKPAGACVSYRQDGSMEREPSELAMCSIIER